MKFGVPEPLIENTWNSSAKMQSWPRSEDLPDLPIQDRDDAAIVAAAIAAKAEVLVTGDHELQSLKNIGQLRIISPRAFWEELTARE